MGEGGSSAAAPSFAAACSWGRGRARNENMSNFSPRSADSRDLFRAVGPVGARASAPGLRARLRHATYESVHVSSLDGSLLTPSRGSEGRRQRRAWRPEEPQRALRRDQKRSAPEARKEGPALR